ncbi:MAG TPA: DUF3240 family protein, partial [Steroidobacteraceae bacterium]|nr:DUF3240 family protein [Steroidobacteraceae bacterium]
MDTAHPVPDCLLLVSCPAGLEEEIIDLLREHPEWVSGFTSLAAEGFGAGTRLHSAMEQVRGRSRRRLLQVVLLQANVQPLVDVLRAAIPSDEVAWWTMPVTGFG